MRLLIDAMAIALACLAMALSIDRLLARCSLSIDLPPTIAPMASYDLIRATIAPMAPIPTHGYSLSSLYATAHSERARAITRAFVLLCILQSGILATLHKPDSQLSARAHYRAYAQILAAERAARSIAGRRAASTTH